MVLWQRPSSPRGQIADCMDSFGISPFPAGMLLSARTVFPADIRGCRKRRELSISARYLPASWTRRFLQLQSAHTDIYIWSKSQHILLAVLNWSNMVILNRMSKLIYRSRTQHRKFGYSVLQHPVQNTRARQCHRAQDLHPPVRETHHKFCRSCLGQVAFTLNSVFKPCTKRTFRLPPWEGGIPVTLRSKVPSTSVC